MVQVARVGHVSTSTVGSGLDSRPTPGDRGQGSAAHGLVWAVGVRSTVTDFPCLLLQSKEGWSDPSVLDIAG